VTAFNLQVLILLLGAFFAGLFVGVLIRFRMRRRSARSAAVITRAESIPPK